MNKPSRFQAAGVSAALSLLFLAVYGACNWITSQRTDVGTWCFAWERYIPFVPWMIVPYMSIDLLFVVAPFLCQTCLELKTFARRMGFALLVAGAWFLLFPLHLAVPRPQAAGWPGAIFEFLHAFDQPCNLFPSLHITLCTLLAGLYARHTRGPVRAASNVWFTLIALSTLLTYQHHVADIFGGLILAAVCFYVIPENTVRSPVIPNFRVGGFYFAGALVAGGLAMSGSRWAAVTVWCALSCLILAAAYAGLGPAIYRKTDGRIPLSTGLLLAPCWIGQHLSLFYYRGRCAAWNQLTPNVWIGRSLTAAEARQLQQAGVTAVLDLTAELSEAPSLRQLNYRNIPILDLTSPSNSQLEEAVTFITQQSACGIVYVHCKVGYSRTAAAAGAYLLASGRARTAAEAERLLRQARPTIIIRPEALAGLKHFASLSSRRRLLLAV